MKKTLLSIFLVSLSFVTFAQSPEIGIRGGATFGKFNLSEPGINTINSGLKISLSFGAYADFKFGNFSLQPAFNYTSREGQLTRENATISSILYYGQVPLDLLYHLHLKTGTVYFGGGPYIAFGLSGTDYLNDAEGNTNSVSRSFGGDDGEYSSTETGLNFIAGLQFKSGFLIHVNYDLGLTNLANSQDAENLNLVINTRTFGLSVGYAF
jgi:hypothetical protein